MNRHGGLQDLDDPSDEEVEILHEICKVASTSTNPPFAALFASYEDFFAAQGLDTARDPSVFRWLMRVADRVRPKRRNGVPVDFVHQLKSLLQDRGILILDQGHTEHNDDASRAAEPAQSGAAGDTVPVRRRVSFDDARLEETWLSEHSKSLNPLPQPTGQGVQRSLSNRGRNFSATHISRPRSISSQRGEVIRRLAPRSTLRVASPVAHTSELEPSVNAVLLFEPSETQLEQNADAFFATSEFRMARRCLHIWHDQTLLVHGRRIEATDIALTRDRRTLLKQSLDILYSAFQQRRAEHRHDQFLQTNLKDLLRRKDRWLLAKAFSHWDESARHQERATAVAQRYAMKVKYFNRWRRVSAENTIKARRILTAKYFGRWRDHVARKKITEERALAHHEESLTKTCFQRWFWKFCSRRVTGWHEQKVEKRTFGGWRARLGFLAGQERQAEVLRNRTLARSSLEKLAQTLQRRQRLAVQAKQRHDRRIALDCMQSLTSGAKLAPLASIASDRIAGNLARKALLIWRSHLSLSRTATAVDHKRILQSAWTNWNDQLRCKALTQRIDERIVVETLYKWVLGVRLRSFQEYLDARIRRRGWDAWASRCAESESRLRDALVTFREQEKVRRLKSGMLTLYSAFRARENLSRTAVEFANARALPAVLGKWRQRTERAAQQIRWAKDARFYCLTSRTLRTWRAKTSEHKHNRRREAYAQIRSKIKYRVVKDAFAQWQAKAAALRPLYEVAVQRQQARLIEVGTNGFDTWRRQAALILQLDRQANMADQRKLQSSVLSSIIIQHAGVIAMEEDAASFRRDSNLALVSTTMKRMQWAAFTASRQAESADALAARNRDQHVRHMLRHLCMEAARRRAARLPTDAPEPDSPSLRPASRLAARAESHAGPDEPVTTTPRRPAYMQTPGRSRRAGRFRSLPTPAAITPFVFDPAYYVTTPAPLSLAVPAAEAAGGPGRDYEGLTPQITPFARKLRAGGITPAAPQSALRSSVFGTGRNAGGTAKSVRFVRSSRFSGGRHT